MATKKLPPRKPSKQTVPPQSGATAGLSSSANVGRRTSRTEPSEPGELYRPSFAGAWFDVKAADHVCLFFDKLQHIKGAKARTPLTLSPWQRAIIRAFFGWKRPLASASAASAGTAGANDTGTRVYRVLYLEVPRKNGKSTLAAGIALYLAFLDREEGAEVYSAALDKDQAAIVFEVALEMRGRCAMLEKRSKANKTRQQITVPATASTYRTIPGDDEGAHGFNAHGVICDELHTQPNRHLWDVLCTSTGSRRQPAIIAITTAGTDKSSICWELHQKALDIRHGVKEDPEFLGVIFAAEPEDDWTDPAVWRKANPGLGESVQESYLASECRKAQENPAYENTFRRLHLNQWTEQDVRIIPMEEWRACADATITDEKLLGEACRGGLDLASTRDVVAWVKVFRQEIEGRLKTIWLPTFWMPRKSIDRRAEQDRALALNFAERGLITLTDGDEADYFAIAEVILADCERFDVLQIGYDQWNARMLLQHLVREGLDAEKRVPMRQSFETYNESFKFLLGGLAGETFAHPGNQVLDWMAANVAHKSDLNGNIRPDKAKSAEKIDGICAGLMGTALWIQAEFLAAEESVYEHRGVRSVSGRGAVRGEQAKRPPRATEPDDDGWGEFFQEDEAADEDRAELD